MKKIVCLVYLLCVFSWLFVSCKKEEINVDIDEYTKAKFNDEVSFQVNGSGLCHAITNENVLHSSLRDKKGNYLYFGITEFTPDDIGACIIRTPAYYSFENPNAFCIFNGVTYERKEGDTAGYYRIERKDEQFLYGSFAFNLVDKKSGKTLSITEGEFKIKRAIPTEGLIKK